MKIDFGTVPFSYAGSYLAFSYPQDAGTGYEKDIVLRILYGLFTDQENFPIYLVDEKGSHLPAEVYCDETELCVSNGERLLRICFQNTDTVIFKANTGIVITKRMLNGSERVMHHDYGMYELAGYRDSLAIELNQGEFKDYSVWSTEGIESRKFIVQFSPLDGILEFQLTLAGLSYRRPELCSYEEALARTQQEYADFKDNFVGAGDRYATAMKEAAYINWHTIVKPQGYVKYPVMLMTKNMMNQVWSWDYAINALAMVDKDPDLAYDQFLAMAACQDEYGCYADCFQAKTMIRSFVKPPVQGFMLRRMFAIHAPEIQLKEKLYQTVADFTNWWFQYRGRGDGIPEYHHGNDSGWDNSTVFKMGVPVKSPDLCAWLIDQMEFLAELAAEIGKPAEAVKWQQRSGELLDKFLNYFVIGDEFVAYKEPEHTVIVNDSLLLYIPLILGEKLPERLRSKTLEKLLAEDRYVTKYGIASEPVNSEYFVEDGYWRGAIWPPTSLIFTDILARNGYMEQARKNARSFCDMCQKEGFFENYSAIDGHGLRDSGFTWTASTFMILLRDY